MSQAPLFDTLAKLFPILEQRTDQGASLVYLDNAATTQKPLPVIKAVNNYYQKINANVHRGSHFLSERATVAFEQARATVQRFINAGSAEQIIWTKGTTEAINLVANSWGLQNLKPGDLIVLSEMEHHANIVPWQLIAEKTGAVIVPIKLKADLTLDVQHYQSLLQQRPKLVALTHVSNAIGTINPIASLIAMAKAVGAKTLVDGAQAVAHFEIDVQQLDCDFYVFSGHKLFAPTGVGVLYGKLALLQEMPPWQGGGEMIASVSFTQTTFNELPFKFEAGTPNISGAIGLAAAIRFLGQFKRELLHAHEQQLFLQLYDWMSAQPDIKLYSPRQDNVGIIAFAIDGEHHQDVGTLLDQQGIAVRTGHHCAMPLMSALGLKGCVRMSFSIYNDEQDVLATQAAISKVISLLEC